MRDKAWFALALLFAVNLLNFFDRQLLGSLGEPIRKEFMLSDTALGLLGTVFTLIYAAVGLPLGRLADRVNRVKLMSAGLTVWSLFTAATGMVHTYTMLFITRLGVGIGEASCAPAGQSLIGDLFPIEKRARAMAIFMLGLPIGTLVAFLVCGYLGDKYSWRVPFFFACIPGLIIALLMLVLREPKRGAQEVKAVQTEQVPHWLAFRELLGCKTLWWIIASGALMNFNMYAINGFTTPFLQRYHGMGLKDANYLNALVLGLTGVLGLLAGGWGGDHFGIKKPKYRLLLAAITMLIGAPCVLLALNVPSGDMVPFMFLMGTALVMIYVYYANVYTALQDVVDPRLRGTAVALYFFAMYVFGGSLGTVVTGALSDHFAHAAQLEAGATQMTEAFRATGLHNAMYMIPVVALAASLVLWAGSLTLSGDVEKLRLRLSRTGA